MNQIKGRVDRHTTIELYSRSIHNRWKCLDRDMPASPVAPAILFGCLTSPIPRIDGKLQRISLSLSLIQTIRFFSLFSNISFLLRRTIFRQFRFFYLCSINYTRYIRKFRMSDNLDFIMLNLLRLHIIIPSQSP